MDLEIVPETGALCSLMTPGELAGAISLQYSVDKDATCPEGWLLLPGD